MTPYSPDCTLYTVLYSLEKGIRIKEPKFPWHRTVPDCTLYTVLYSLERGIRIKENQSYPDAVQSRLAFSFWIGVSTKKKEKIVSRKFRILYQHQNCGLTLYRGEFREGAMGPQPPFLGQWTLWFLGCYSPPPLTENVQNSVIKLSLCKNAMQNCFAKIVQSFFCNGFP